MLCVGVLPAQNTKTNARKLFSEGKFEEAKPVLLNLLQRSPNSAEYNYWYAACCIETGEELPDVEERLEMAASRRVLNAFYYQGLYCSKNYRFPEAIEYYEEYFEIGKDEKLMERATLEHARAKEMLRTINATEQLCVIDSFIVDKNKFLSAYKIGKDAGRLYMAADYFDDESFEGVLAMTERGTDMYYSENVALEGEPQQRIMHASKNGEEWGQARQIKGFDTGGNDAYPFMSADGATFYFASDGEGSIGGYDIFVTRYDNSIGRFLRPTNVGMPFNSEANDYMLVVNEIANLGWFATDRRMPEGKVCVYVFIPNDMRKTYDYEKVGYKKMAAYSLLNSIGVTQHDEDAVRKARQQLAMLQFEMVNDDERGDFLFVLDDMTDYTSLSNFRSGEARKLFIEWQKRTSAYKRDSAALENQRARYASEGAAGKQKLAAGILKEERRLETEYEALQQMEKMIRVKEISHINK